MSVETFRSRLRVASIGASEAEWFPRWLDGYRQHCQCDRQTDLPVTETLLIGFLRSLRDNKILAWRRLQAARAIELYQQTVIRSDGFDFGYIKKTLHERSRIEQAAGSAPPTTPAERSPVAGEWNPGHSIPMSRR